VRKNVRVGGGTFSRCIGKRKHEVMSLGITDTGEKMTARDSVQLKGSLHQWL